MARNRMIKPEFWDDEKLSKVSRDARLTFIGLWTHSDDVGVTKGNTKWLQNNIFPYDSIKSETFQKWIDELVQLKVIMPFKSNGESYIHIKSFQKHQTINKPSSSKNPYPEETLLREYYYITTEGLQPEDKIREEKLSISEIEEKRRESDLVLNHWNNFAEKNNLPAIKEITGKRKKYIELRSREPSFNFNKILEEIKNSDFLLGKVKDFKISFDWIIESPNNYLKILEGNYKNGTTDGNNRTANKGFDVGKNPWITGTGDKAI